MQSLAGLRLGVGIQLPSSFWVWASGQCQTPPRDPPAIIGLVNQAQHFACIVKTARRRFQVIPTDTSAPRAAQADCWHRSPISWLRSLGACSKRWQSKWDAKYSFSPSSTASSTSLVSRLRNHAPPPLILLQNIFGDGPSSGSVASVMERDKLCGRRSPNSCGPAPYPQ